MKNLFKKRIDKYQLLEEKIENLEGRIFKEESFDLMGLSWLLEPFRKLPLEDQVLELGIKIGAICKSLNLELKETKKEWVAEKKS